jgi:hypothetical protein
MPIPKNTNLHNVSVNISQSIANYNGGNSGSAYNWDYNLLISARNRSLARAPLSAWLSAGAAASIETLLNSFGMNVRNSTLVPVATFDRVLRGLNPNTIDWLASKSLPLSAPYLQDINPQTKRTLSDELSMLYDTLSQAGNVTISGGYVAASKAAHCLLPNLVPMIDGAHTGISYFNINRVTYLPPPSFGSGNWDHWVGHAFVGTVNPSPRGSGRYSWNADQFLAAIGVNQHLYENWQLNAGYPGLAAFLSLDATIGTTGIPRIIDKVLW